MEVRAHPLPAPQLLSFPSQGPRKGIYEPQQTPARAPNPGQPSQPIRIPWHSAAWQYSTRSTGSQVPPGLHPTATLSNQLQHPTTHCLPLRCSSLLQRRPKPTASRDPLILGSLLPRHGAGRATFLLCRRLHNVPGHPHGSPPTSLPR